MENSVFGTNLKIAMQNKDEYHKDNGKNKRTKKYTMEHLAIDTGYSVHTIHGWTKKGGRLPSLIEIKKIADILNVDTAYLLGEQVCQRNASQTICNVTKLNETAAKVLSELDGIEADIMNELLNHENFNRLILFAWDYTHSHNKEVAIINTLDGSKDLPHTKESQREIMKYRATDTFGKILDDIYDAHLQDAINAKFGFILSEMKREIEPFIKYKDVDEARQNLLGLASYWQNEIKKLRLDFPICKLTPEQIIDNFNIIKEFL